MEARSPQRLAAVANIRDGGPAESSRDARVVHFAGMGNRITVVGADDCEVLCGADGDVGAPGLPSRSFPDRAELP